MLQAAMKFQHKVGGFCILTQCIHLHPQRSQCMALELVLLSFDLVSEESVRNNFEYTKPSAMPQAMHEYYIRVQYYLI